ncbi:hypothetical protein CLV90_0549 [Maribacter spongiicola]|uniref:Fibronectin type-III domain-containing protein n=1 Tax=Maribacter spongiicola TaxID=1206753 RepID=A0A4R7K7V4_9FLAO|nr:hypothetical protein [Maribacter spongiicola]TDT46498.1 hypothetical protein CLV90_0549 [Maribacter spongiicola]
MKKLILILKMFILLMISCKGEFKETEEQGQVDLTFPANAQVCPDGEQVGNDKIELKLLWDSDTNFSKYRITIDRDPSFKSTNKLTGLVSAKKDTIMRLDRGTLYYWFVSGLRGKEVIPSKEVWSFYTLGNATNNHIPYPAEIQINASNENITISWIGRDEDSDDTLIYDVLLSTENPPLTIVLENSELTEITENFTTGVTYYVQVITKDQEGSSSSSQIISFIP